MRNPGHFCLRGSCPARSDGEEVARRLGKILLVESEILGFGLSPSQRFKGAMARENAAENCLVSGAEESFSFRRGTHFNLRSGNPITRHRASAEDRARESGIQLRESGSLLRVRESRIQVPLNKVCNTVPGTQESTTWNPESKTVLDSLMWRDTQATDLTSNRHFLATFAGPAKITVVVVITVCEKEQR